MNLKINLLNSLFAILLVRIRIPNCSQNLDVTLSFGVFTTQTRNKWLLYKKKKINFFLDLQSNVLGE